MSATWTFPGSVIRLTLDGTGSGEKSSTRTFAGLEVGELYTFYLAVDPDVVAVGAFLEVEGGDTTVADVTGSQTLRARGTADGSGEITVRFGAQSIENAPASEGTFPLDYANQAAAEADGFVVTPGGGTIAFGYAVGLTGYSTGVRMTQTGSGALAHMALTLALAASSTYTVRLRAKPLADSAWWNPFALQLTSGASSASDSLNGGDPEQTLSVSLTTDGTGALTIDLRLGSAGAYSSFVMAGLEIEGVTGGGATIDFSALTYCLGSGTSETGGTGVGPGDGEGGPGTDPIPDPPVGGYPPPPVGGVRPYGMQGIPVEGLGYWNSVIKIATPSWLPNLVSGAGTAGTYPFFVFGSTEDWLDGAGVFSYIRWQATVDAVYYNAIARAILEGAIADGSAFAHLLIDESYWAGRWGIVIPIATIERMALYSKSLYPTWPTAIRVAPTQGVNGTPYVTRHINGLDWLWAQYWAKYGNVTAYRDNNIARVQELDHGLVIGLNVADFLGAPSRPITPDELRYYGGILASSDVPVAFMGWRYEAEMYAQSGFPDAVKYVRDLFASFDP